MIKRSYLKRKAKAVLDNNFWQSIGLTALSFVTCFVFALIVTIGLFRLIMGIFGTGALIYWIFTLVAGYPEHIIGLLVEYIIIELPLVVINIGTVIMTFIYIFNIFMNIEVLTVQTWNRKFVKSKNVTIKVWLYFSESIKKYAPKGTLLVFVQTILIFCWSLLFIVLGIIKYYSYSQAIYIYRDKVDAGEKNISILKCITESRQMMRGHKLELFILDLSFILWWLLCIVTCGIALFWGVPYVLSTKAFYYESLKVNKIEIKE